MKHALEGVAVLTIAAFSATAGAWTPGQTELFDKAVEEYVYFSDGAGAAYAVAAGSDQPLVVVKGLADIPNRTPLGPEHVYRIGSVTKTFVAVTVLQLVEEGKLSLDDLLSTWYPAYPNADNVTIKMLLNMTTGFTDYLEVSGIDYGKTWTPEELIELSLEGSAYFEPGAAWAYSNTNYIFLGRIVEEVTGHTIGAELRARIFDKLGLLHTWFDGEETVTDPMPRGYVHSWGSLYDYTYGLNASLAWAAGAIVSSPGDLIRYAQGVFGGGLLSADSLAKLIDFIHVDGVPVYGLGVVHYDTAIGAAWGHDGSTGEFMTILMHVPDKNLYSVILNNSDNYDQYAFNDEGLLIAAGAPTFAPRDCTAPDGFLSTSGAENRLTAKFRGVINAADPSPAPFRAALGILKLDRFGFVTDTNYCREYAYLVESGGEEFVNFDASCYEGGRYNVGQLTGRLYRVSVPLTSFAAARDGGYNQFAAGEKTSAAVSDFTYDLDKAVAVKFCYVALKDNAGASDLFVCHSPGTQFAAGEEIVMWGSIAMRTEIPAPELCFCWNDTTQAYDNCPLVDPEDGGMRDAGTDGGADGSSDAAHDTVPTDSGSPFDAQGPDGPEPPADFASEPESEGGCGCTTLGPVL
ncbi:MAG: beta-lactamase family protein [Deltaproteobacteria bacterium]|nr:beta-lactamase family protein [Deltaproteobacteria bacterium]